MYTDVVTNDIHCIIKLLEPHSEDHFSNVYFTVFHSC